MGTYTKDKLWEAASGNILLRRKNKTWSGHYPDIPFFFSFLHYFTYNVRTSVAKWGKGAGGDEEEEAN